MYSWGQFIDHDLDLVTSDGVNHIDIRCRAIRFLSALNPADPQVIDRTGAGPTSHAINQITGWLDASMVYGSDQATSPTVCAWPTGT